MWAGSLRPLTHLPSSKRSGLVVGSSVCTKRWPGCVGLMSQYGASVSSMSSAAGMARTTARLSSVRSEHPLMQMCSPSAWHRATAASLSSKEWTTPPRKRARLRSRMGKKSSAQLRMCRKSGSPVFSASTSCASNHRSWTSFEQKCSRSQSSPSSPMATTLSRLACATSSSCCRYRSPPCSSSMARVGCTPTVVNKRGSCRHRARALWTSASVPAVMMMRCMPACHARSSICAKSSACLRAPRYTPWNTASVKLAPISMNLSPWVRGVAAAAADMALVFVEFLTVVCQLKKLCVLCLSKSIRCTLVNLPRDGAAATSMGSPTLSWWRSGIQKESPFEPGAFRGV
eukprot:m.178838 g.178838  ORF g.178838 m.178838 type:complete len:344 (+) comp15362_c0_seq1:296-1327(+)